MDDQQPIEQKQQALHAALDKLEASVETPLVPGEAERWIESVEADYQVARSCVLDAIGERHPEQYTTIWQEDEGLARRIEQLREEDTAIREAAESLGRHVSGMKSAIAKVEPDEAKLQSALEALVAEALRFIIRVRTLEQAIRTWVMEAFNRDRGTVD